MTMTPCGRGARYPEPAFRIQVQGSVDSSAVVEIAHDKEFLHIISDDADEGHALIRIEALPAVIKALTEIQKLRQIKEIR
jgi:activator of HSP90 ATPase